MMEIFELLLQTNWRILSNLKFESTSKSNLFIECCHGNDIVKANYLLNLKDGPVDVNSKSEDKNWSGKGRVKKKVIFITS